MNADVPTLMLMVIVSSAVMAASLLMLGWGRHQDGLQYWAASLLVSAMGYVLFLLRGRIPDVLSIVLGNTLMGLATAGLLTRNLRGKSRGLARGSSEQAVPACGTTLASSGQSASEIQATLRHPLLPTGRESCGLISAPALFRVARAACLWTFWVHSSLNYRDSENNLQFHIL